MLKKLDKCTVFSVIFFVTAFLFWWLYRPDAMYYQEIFQLFIWDSAYFADLVSIPGGLADYVSEFLVQFYYYPVLGAAIIAAIFTALLLMVYQLGKFFHKDEYGFQVIHALPVMLLWQVMYDVNVMHNFMLAILIALLISWLCLKALRSGVSWKIWTALAAIPAGYFLFGPVVVIPLILSIIYIIRNRMGWVYAVGVSLALALVMAVSMSCVLYPLPRFLYGIDYYRYHGFNVWMFAVVCLFVLGPLVQWRILLRKGWGTAALQFGAWLLMLWYAVSYYEFYKYQTIRYLKLTHECKWQEIVEDASRNIPETPYTMVMVNTALAFQHQLTDRMFAFPQEDSECLLPSLQNDLLHPLLIADAFYWMGLNDHAIHYYFESKTGNPTYRGSRFAYMRLAECYIVNGDYGVAYKYLNQLKKTLFFKGLAKSYMGLIETGNVDSYPLFATLRQIKLTTNGLQAVGNMPESLRNLLKENPNNYLAYEFLMGYNLLKCDLTAIAEDLSLGSQLQYNKLPMHLQEALIFFWNSHYGNIDNLPSAISQEVRMRFQKQLTTQESYWPYLFKNKDRQNYDQDEHEVQ